MRLMMLAYSAMLMVGLVVSAPWWLVRMATTERYREGLKQRLGFVPAALRGVVRGKRVVWVHAVSVGEVLAGSRLVAELETALGDGWVVVVSTTTRTGQGLARERFGAGRVFYFPLDFAWAVRAYLRVLQPAAQVLMESEVWPRMVWECGRAGVPVVVVNARVSDRSFARAMKVRGVWGRVLRGVSLWMAQSEEDGRRLVAMGARVEAVKVGGNLKFDVRAPEGSRVAELIKEAAGGRPIVVAGSTVEFERIYEDQLVVEAWRDRARVEWNALLVLAPRHPEHFGGVEGRALEYRTLTASDLKAGVREAEAFTTSGLGGDGLPVELVVLDTIGDLAAVYAIADVAFVGGSLVKRGGHNPLEPARFGLPVVMGPSYENFRGIVEALKEAGGIAVVGETAGLSAAAAKSATSGRDDTFGVVEELEREFVRLLADREAARAMGERGRRVFEAEQGATGRAVVAIVGLLGDYARVKSTATTEADPYGMTTRKTKATARAEADPYGMTTRKTKATATAEADPYGMTARKTNATTATTPEEASAGERSDEVKG
jgi:3-deoxy-D-manno-octulosonic-acid transferase